MIFCDSCPAIKLGNLADFYVPTSNDVPTDTVSNFKQSV